MKEQQSGKQKTSSEKPQDSSSSSYDFTSQEGGKVCLVLVYDSGESFPLRFKVNENTPLDVIKFLALGVMFKNDWSNGTPYELFVNGNQIFI